MTKISTDPPAFHVRPAQPEEAGAFFAQYADQDEQMGAIGHVRIDFGNNGKGFFHTWHPRGRLELNVSKAFYPYYGIPVYYMVLSNRRLRDAELCQINNVRVGPGMIKIRYNKKNYERLLSIVPSRIAMSLQAQFKDIPPKRFNFCI